MAWLMIDQNILSNGKTQQVAVDLDIRCEDVFLHLFRLWSWAVDDAREDGRLRNKDSRVVARVAGWDGDPEQFVAALVNAGGEEEFGFLERKPDGALYIHDWTEYTGKFVAKRRADAERKRNQRAKSTGQTEDETDEPESSMGYVARTSGGRHADVRAQEKDKELEQDEKNEGTISSSDADAPTAEIGPVFGDDSPEYELAAHLADRKLENNPKSKPTSEKQLQNWANDVRLMVQRDDRSLSDIRALIDWSQSDDFWRANILSMGKLREKYDQLWLKMTTPIPARASPNRGGARNGAKNGADRIRERLEAEQRGQRQREQTHRGDWRIIPELPA